MGMIDQEQRQRIIKSWRLAEPLGETVTELFYRRLFELAPQYRALFGEDMEPQKRKLLTMLRFLVKSCDWPDETWSQTVDSDNDLFLVVLALGRRHTDLYRVPDEAYATVGEALLWTLDYGLGEAFDHATRDAWSSLYTLVSNTMKMGRYAVGEASSMGAMQSQEASHV